MTPDEIAAIFAAATDDFTVVVGQPSDEDINAIERALLPLLHDVDYDMYGAQNLIGLIEPTITYTLTWGQAFVRPPRPTAYDLNIADTASPVVRNRMEAAHTLLLNNYYSFVAAEKGAAKFIRTCVDETYYKDLQHATTFYNKVTAEELLSHLRSNCGVGRARESHRTANGNVLLLYIMRGHPRVHHHAREGPYHSRTCRSSYVRQATAHHRFRQCLRLPGLPSCLRGLGTSHHIR